MARVLARRLAFGPGEMFFDLRSHAISCQSYEVRPTQLRRLQLEQPCGSLYLLIGIESVLVRDYLTVSEGMSHSNG
jgi:hypothetical protein